MCKTRWEHYLLSESNWKLYPFHLTQPQDHHFRQLLKKVESNDEHYKTSITLQLSLEIYQQHLCWDFASCYFLAETIKKFLLSWEYRTRPSSDNKTKFMSPNQDKRNHQWHGQLERSAGITNSQWHRTEANACLCQKARENWRVW